MNILKIFTVYDSPSDFPDLFVARQFDIIMGRVIPNTTIIKSKSLDDIRNELNSRGLTKICRQKNDEPKIVESWI